MEVPKFVPVVERSLQERLERLLDLRPSDPGTPVTRFADWNLDVFPVPGDPESTNFLAVGIGASQVVQFDEDMLATVLRWLASDENAWLIDLRAAMDGPRYEITQPELAPDPDLVIGALTALLVAVGDFGLSWPAAVGGATIPAVDVLGLVRQLASLRSALLLALAFQKLETPAAFWGSIEREMEHQSPGIVAALHEHFGQPGSTRFALARLWVVTDMSRLGIVRLTEMGAPGDPVQIDPGPRTPMQALWFTIALSVGAIVPPYPMPGVFQCSYHRCRQVFVSRRIGVGGKLRFCSVAHGKRYHAAKRMKTKSKKTPPQPQTED